MNVCIYVCIGLFQNIHLYQPLNGYFMLVIYVTSLGFSFQYNMRPVYNSDQHPHLYPEFPLLKISQSETVSSHLSCWPLMGG